MPGRRVTCRSFSSLARNKCVHPSILPCNNPFRLICSNVACSGSRYPMNRKRGRGHTRTLFYQALHVDESTSRFPPAAGTHFTVSGGGTGRQTPLFFREKRINKYICRANSRLARGGSSRVRNSKKRDVSSTVSAEWNPLANRGGVEKE